jgi:hypothetical protein
LIDKMRFSMSFRSSRYRNAAEPPILATQSDRAPQSVHGHRGGMFRRGLTPLNSRRQTRNDCSLKSNESEKTPLKSMPAALLAHPRSIRACGAAALLLLAGNAWAQLGGYSGPGVLSRGAGNIGQRSGEQVDLRFFGNVMGFYDTGLLPVSVDSQGNLVNISGLYGVEAGLGVYGVHNWRRSRLGLDYQGSYRHYSQNQYFNGSDHRLGLGYTFQKSRRLVFDFRALGGSLSRGIGGVTTYTAIPDAVVDPGTALLFDNRTNYIQTGMDVNILQSPRTMYTLGGDGYTVRRQSNALVGVNGYNLHGSVVRQITRFTSLGAGFQHIHYDFPRAFGEADINLYHLIYGRALGRYWTLSFRGGLYNTEVQGLERVSLDPAVVALLGVSTGVRTFYRRNWLPSAEIALTRQFQHATLSFNYGRIVNSGNGIYLTSRGESAGVNLSYTGIRRWSFSLYGGYNTLSGLGQGLQPYRQYNGGAGASLAITRSLHFLARYDARKQEIDLAGFRRSSYRATVGFSFSPGDIPVSLW